jgi:hypothetical protein
LTKVTTPSQLKAELESQKTYLLEACLMAFNQHLTSEQKARSRQHTRLQQRLITCCSRKKNKPPYNDKARY